ncbi:IcmE-like type IV secretion system protein (plasmid) [Stenotrophomonas maltophilia]|uniref:DotG/IcmE/VirB10 family protein n=1 Tax=Stenotrophomonas maltophilia TaxID=40324 RepID=UPI001D0C2C26|nr:DotG/IcmE/VirB10 family protein [Stenotrophomonas maltophilia]UXF74661.1 IcmE-like type IV secretion system protein [Stenotrophomonas maltophilia]
MAQQESDIKLRAGNIASALKHGPTRLIFIGGIVLSLVVVVLAFSFMGGGKPANNGEVVLESVPEPTVAPSGQTLTNTEAYDALAQQSDIQALKQAQQTGGTAMPMPRPGQAAAEAKGEVTIDGTGVNMNAVPEPAAAAATTAQAQSAEATARLQQHEQQVQARYAAMSKQYDNLVGRWISVQTPVSVAVNQERKAGEAADAQAASASVASTASDDMAETTSSALLRANDTYLGITLGDATTDDRLPLVRARILNGPGKGSVMRGTIETSEFAPGGFIHFTSLTPPDGALKRDAVEIDAVAIDPATSRASVGDVNRHTASRMASLFFSSVLSGVSEALIAGGQQENVVTTGQTVVVQKDAFNDRQLALVGLGKVGTNATQMLQPTINRKPTASIGQKTEIGVLFLSDVPASAFGK